MMIEDRVVRCISSHQTLVPWSQSGQTRLEGTVLGHIRKGVACMPNQISPKQQIQVVAPYIPSQRGHHGEMHS